MKEFLSQYAAVRFATGGRFRRPSFLGQVLKAGVMIMVVAMLLPWAILQFIARQIKVVPRSNEETDG